MGIGVPAEKQYGDMVVPVEEDEFLWDEKGKQRVKIRRLVKASMQMLQ